MSLWDVEDIARRQAKEQEHLERLMEMEDEAFDDVLGAEDIDAALAAEEEAAAALRVREKLGDAGGIGMEEDHDEEGKADGGGGAGGLDEFDAEFGDGGDLAMEE